jgi:hypothetical protein
MTLGHFPSFSLPVSPLLFFGPYCLLIGYLIFSSTFLPRVLGVFMAFAGHFLASEAEPRAARGCVQPCWDRP